MSRLPLRVRLTLVFAAAMAVVLAATGAFVYARVGASLSDRLDDGLRVRADALAAAPGQGGRPLAGGEEDLAQLAGADGAVTASSPGLARPLLSPAEAGAGRRGEVWLEKDVLLPGETAAEPVRLLARPLGSGVAVVGASLDDRAEALDGLVAQLLLGGTIALVAASAAGYLLAGAALRPVEAMRRRAAAVTAETSGERLPLPAARDEIHELATTLNAMLERLDAGLARERRFVADASHELRTPLALLRAEVDLALRRPRSRAELEAALRSVAEEVDRLARLAEDLLVLASAEEGRLPLRESRFAARDLLAGVAGRFAAAAADAGAAVEVAAGPDEELDADRRRLEQALGNLLDNAIRHGAGPIELAAARGEGCVVLRVSDRGPGFPPELLGHAFERFTRADGARSAGGSGLGLAIVAAIARAHGGRAEARDRAGGGAEVLLSLPDSPQRSSAINRAARAAPSVSTGR